MKSRIPAGYSVPDGDRVTVPVDHTLITGRTQQSGKTTLAEAMAHHVDCPVLAFLTKPDEKGFRDAHTIPLYNRDRADWEFVVSILEASLRKPSLHMAWIMKLCEAGSFKKATWRRPRSLADVLANCEIAWGKGGSLELTKLRGYLRKVVPTMARLEFTSKLRLADGINVMDLRGLALPVQFIVMTAALDWVYEHGQRMIVLIPEAQKFFPRELNTPVKAVGERIIQEKGAAKVFLWLDTQMMRNLDPVMRGQMGLWLFGVQRDVNEARRTLEHIPEEPDGPPKPTLGQLMRLRRGFFIAAHGQTLVPQFYVQPFWVPDVHAQAIARGEEEVASAEEIWDEQQSSIGSQPVPEGANDEEEAGEEQATESGETGLGDAAGFGRTTDESEGLPGSARSAGKPDQEAEAAARRLPAGVGRAVGNRDREHGADHCGAGAGRKPDAAATEEEEEASTNPDPPLSEGEKAELGEFLTEEYEATGAARLDEIVEEAETVNAQEKELLELARTVGMETALRELRVAKGGSIFADQFAASPPAGGEAQGARGGDAQADGEMAAASRPRPLQNRPLPLDDGDVGNFEAFYQAIKARAQKEAPAVLQLLAQQPELRVKLDRAVISAEGVLVPLARLLKEGFFSNGEGRRSRAVEKEFGRRGWPESRVTIYKGMMELCRLGFLVREEVGKREYEYHAVPGMKVVTE